MRRRRGPVILLMFLSVFGLIGCGKRVGGGGNPGPEVTELKDIWEVYRIATEQKKKPPSGPADLKGLGTAFPEALRALREGQCVVYWNADLKSGDPAGTVLGYEKKVPAEGGWVLMKDGRTKTMTASEFQAAPKAGK